MSEGQPSGPSVPGDLGLGCLWHLLFIGTLLAAASLIQYANREVPSDLARWLYGLGVVALVGLQFRRRRPYVALGVILLPVVSVLVFWGCVAISGVPWV